jgi:hypothetical protein
VSTLDIGRWQGDQAHGHGWRSVRLDGLHDLLNSSGEDSGTQSSPPTSPSTSTKWKVCARSRTSCDVRDPPGRVQQVSPHAVSPTDEHIMFSTSTHRTQFTQHSIPPARDDRLRRHGRQPTGPPRADGGPRSIRRLTWMPISVLPKLALVEGTTQLRYTS